LAVVRRVVVLIVVVLGVLVLPSGVVAWGKALPPWAHVDLGAAPSLLAPHRAPAPKPGGLAGCATGFEYGQGSGAPRVAIVGASITAGVGAGDPYRSWAVLLTRMEHWDGMIYGDPGAGYVRRGVQHRGPVAAELSRVQLRALRPALVIIQAGHNDIGEPLPLVRQRVAQAIALIRAEAPQARIALLTVFPGRSHPALADRTDQAIVTAAQAADHDVIIMDPLTGRWAYSRSHDRLHPTAGGDLQIAQKVAAALRAQGLVPGPAGRGGFVCDTAIGIRPPQPR
jgi:lysophospholipase L1-like esterase